VDRSAVSLVNYSILLRPLYFDSAAGLGLRLCHRMNGALNNVTVLTGDLGSRNTLRWKGPPLLGLFGDGAGGFPFLPTPINPRRSSKDAVGRPYVLEVVLDVPTQTISST
jgi:hypothetical protein